MSRRLGDGPRGVVLGIAPAASQNAVDGNLGRIEQKDIARGVEVRGENNFRGHQGHRKRVHAPEDNIFAPKVAARERALKHFRQGAEVGAPAQEKLVVANCERREFSPAPGHEMVESFLHSGPVRIEQIVQNDDAPGNEHVGREVEIGPRVLHRMRPVDAEDADASPPARRKQPIGPNQSAVARNDLDVRAVREFRKIGFKNQPVAAARSVGVEFLISEHVDRDSNFVRRAQVFQDDEELAVMDADLGHVADDAVALLPGVQGERCGDRAGVQPSLDGLNAASEDIVSDNLFHHQKVCSGTCLALGSSPSAFGPVKATAPLQPQTS